jgi:hypothetical protein
MDEDERGGEGRVSQNDEFQEQVMVRFCEDVPWSAPALSILL